MLLQEVRVGSVDDGLPGSVPHSQGVMQMADVQHSHLGASRRPQEHPALEVVRTLSEVKVATRGDAPSQRTPRTAVSRGWAASEALTWTESGLTWPPVKEWVGSKDDPAVGSGRAALGGCNRSRHAGLVAPDAQGQVPIPLHAYAISPHAYTRACDVQGRMSTTCEGWHGTSADCGAVAGGSIHVISRSLCVHAIPCIRTVHGLAIAGAHQAALYREDLNGTAARHCRSQKHRGRPTAPSGCGASHQRPGCHWPGGMERGAGPRQAGP